MSFASSYHVFYWLQLPKKKKGPLSPDIFQAKIHVKCSSFRDMGPVRPKSGKQDVQTGPGQGRHLPKPLRPKNRPAATGADHSVTSRPVLEVSAQS